jgi:3-oxoacyl-[acyl-carrier protein] reductase
LPLYSSGAALVLGGSGGLGAACARRIASDGNAVALSFYKNKAAADDVLASIGDGISSAHQLDVSNAAQCAQMIADVVSTHERINSLVYAVGSNIGQPLVSEISDQQWAQVMSNDLSGFINVIRPVIKHMQEKHGGSLVHLSSAGLGRTPPRDALSIAPKAAIDALMSTIAAEEGKHGIRANSVGVGVIEAGIFIRLEAQGVFDDEWKAAVKASLPLASFGQAEDIAEAVAFFASNRSKYITGQRLYVDGGYNV